MEKDGTHLILFKNTKKDEVFLVRRSDYPLWVTTGGGIENGEKPIKAAIREAEEETGFKVKAIRNLVKYNLINNEGRKTRKEYVYEGRVISGKFKPEFPGCLGKWFNINKLPINIGKGSKSRIIDAKKQQGSSVLKLTRKEETIWDHSYLLIFSPVKFIRFLAKRFSSQKGLITHPVCDKLLLKTW